MKKEEIENKDKELIKKFRTIIHNKKEIEEKPTPKSFSFGLIFLLTILIISSLLFLKEQPLSLFSKEPKTSSRGELVQVPAKQPASSAHTKKIKASSDTQKVPPPNQKVVDRKTIPKSSDSVLNNLVLEQKSPEKFSNQKVQGDMPSGIRIEEIISCSSVNNKQYSRPKIEFSLAQDAKPKIWMKVISENPPFTLIHVYYCNGQKYCEVPLTIRYHRMRTWSTVTLRSPKHIGKWRVEVIDDNGTKLDQIEFTVVK